jgi:hypothetical protein
MARRCGGLVVWCWFDSSSERYHLRFKIPVDLHFGGGKWSLLAKSQYCHQFKSAFGIT